MNCCKAKDNKTLSDMAFKLPVVGQIEFGEKKVSNFWITIAILTTVALIVSSVTGIFKRKKRR